MSFKKIFHICYYKWLLNSVYLIDLHFSKLPFIAVHIYSTPVNNIKKEASFSCWLLGYQIIKLHISFQLIFLSRLQFRSNALAEGFHPLKPHAASNVDLFCHQSHSSCPMQKQRDEATKASYLTEWSRHRFTCSTSNQKSVKIVGPGKKSAIFYGC